MGTGQDDQQLCGHSLRRERSSCSASVRWPARRWHGAGRIPPHLPRSRLICIEFVPKTRLIFRDDSRHDAGPREDGIKRWLLIHKYLYQLKDKYQAMFAAAGNKTAPVRVAEQDV